VSSASDGVVNGDTNSAHDLVVNTTKWTCERTLSNSMKAVAIDDRGLVDPDVIVVKVNLCRKAPLRCRDLGDGYESPYVKYLRSREQQNWTALLADLGQPDLTAPHG
jgi:hypothetical protein